MKPISRKGRYDDPATIFDRLAVAFVSGLVAFITASLIWLLFIVLGVKVKSISSPITIPVEFIWWFTGVMTVSGFLLLENFLLKVFGAIWQVIAALFR